MRDTAGVGAKKPRERELRREERKGSAMKLSVSCVEHKKVPTIKTQKLDQENKLIMSKIFLLSDSILSISVCEHHVSTSYCFFYICRSRTLELSHRP